MPQVLNPYVSGAAATSHREEQSRLPECRGCALPPWHDIGFGRCTAANDAGVL